MFQAKENKARWKIRLREVLLFFLVFFLWTTNAFAENLKEISTSDVRVLVDINGGGYSFFSKTGGNLVPCLYPSYWNSVSHTSKLTARIDGRDYVLGPYGTSPSSYSVGINFIELYWTVGGVRITLRFSFPFSTVIEQRLTATPVDGRSHTVGFRILWDTDVARDDAARFNVVYGENAYPVYYETVYEGSNLPDRWEVYTGSLKAICFIKNFYVTTPDKIILGRWPGNIGTVWDAGSPRSSYGDSAAITYWYPASVFPGQSLSRNIFFGVSAPNNRPPIINGLSYSPNGTIIAGVTAVTFTVTASDPDNDPLTFQWAVRDPGGNVVNIGNNSPTLVWKPPSPGTWIIGVTVMDGKGGTANRSVSLTAVWDFTLQVAASQNVVSRGQKLRLYASLITPTNERVVADSIALKDPRGQNIPLNWDAVLRRYWAEILIPEGSASGGYPGNGTYAFSFTAVKNDVSKNAFVYVTIQGNIKEKVYVRTLEW
ncbi:PKD domain-containing protein [Neomoorella thermoacetica]|uniref:PKD domain-containing protein n=1 Tax=Neomoorella thermoacetica TaxID=1525 RepID=UPI0030CAF9A3